jgi:hypothetical protein
MLKKRRQERLPEKKNPGDREVEPCSPGSIEQQLDMCEEGSLRGDNILYQHGVDRDSVERENPPLDEDSELRFNDDMSEEDREGDDMSGDEHSSGLQGEEPELEQQPHILTSIPGDYNKVAQQAEIKAGEVMGPDDNLIRIGIRRRLKKSIKKAS